MSSEIDMSNTLKKLHLMAKMKRLPSRTATFDKSLASSKTSHPERKISSANFKHCKFKSTPKPITKKH